MADESRSYPDRIYAGHLGGGRRIWKPDLMDASEAAFSREYVRADLASAAPEMLEALRKIKGNAAKLASDPMTANRGLWSACADDASAAIAKAEGRK